VRIRPQVLPRLATALALVALALAAPTVKEPALAARVTLRIVDQTTSAPPGEPIRLVVRLGGTIPADATVVVRTHAPVTNRRALQSAFGGTIGNPLDQVTLPLADQPRTKEGFVDILVPTTDGDPEVGKLRLAEVGIHPLTVQLRTGGASTMILGEVLTFVHLEPPGGARGDLEIAYIARVRSRPTQRPDGGTTIEPATRTQVQRLVALLENTPATFSVNITPELLDGLGRSSSEDQELLARLEAALGDRELLVGPYVSLDPSGSARSGLLDTYTRQLRVGEDVLAKVLPRQVARRAVYLVEEEIDAGGASLLRDLGVRSLVLLPGAVARLDQLGPPDSTTIDRTLLVDVLIGTEATMPAALVDDGLAAQLAEPGDDPQATARRLLMELLAIRLEVLERFGGLDDPNVAPVALVGRSLTVTTTTGEVGDPALLAPLLSLISETPGLMTATASVTGAITDTAIVDGLPVTLHLPARAGPELDALAEQLSLLSIDTTTIGSMLPEEDPRPAAWDRQTLVLPATELTSAERDAFSASLRHDLDEIRDAVASPSVNDVTLGGRNSTIRLKLRNDAEVPLTVIVRLESSKLSFPSGQELVTLPPQELTEVEIPVEARTNGRFPVSVTLLTPEGEVPLHPPVEFAARVNAITGLGQVVTVVGALILASWWVQHFRVRRRAKLAPPAAASSVDPP
jgi:hypothetical protein